MAFPGWRQIDANYDVFCDSPAEPWNDYLRISIATYSQCRDMKWQQYTTYDTDVQYELNLPLTA